MAGTDRAARPGMASRAVAAVLLWLGFYGLGVGVACALLLLPVAQVRVEGSLGISGIFSGLGALAVAWALFPRIERDKTEEEPISAPHPELVSLVSDVAKRVGQRAPDVVVLMPEANAFAARTGGFLGFRARSVVGVGLGMCVVLDRNELSSVIAHELGHHHGGELLLGPWIIRTRRAIGRALDRLEGSSFWLHLPFVAYGELFLRVTRRASREQELAADALAVKTIGPEATASALLRVHELGALWDVYWDEEVLPLLKLGARPPIVEGFAKMRAETRLRRAITDELDRIAKRPPSPIDTHPPLAERLAEIGARAPAVTEAASGTTLLGDLPAAEIALVERMLIDPTKMPPLVPWAEVGPVLMAGLYARTEAHAPLADASPAALPDILRDGDVWAARLRGGLAIFSPEAERRRLRTILGEWLAVSLHEAGYSPVRRPGAELELIRGDEVVRPLEVLRDLVSGDVSAEAWRTRWNQLSAPI